MISLSAELLAFLLIFILFLNTHERNRAHLRSSKSYMICLFGSFLSVAMDIIFFLVARSFREYPLAVFLVGTAYLTLSAVTYSLFIRYFCGRLIEGRRTPKNFDKMKFFMTIPIVVYITFILINAAMPFRGFLFTFSESGEYIPGNINKLSLAMLLSHVAFAIYYLFKLKAYKDKNIRKSLFLAGPVVAFLVLFHMVYPDIMLRGAVAAATSLISYICFQSRLIDLDSNTAIGSRSSLIKNISDLIQDERSFSIILISIYNFGHINRTYGYEAGDELLYSVARWLEENLPDSIIFRFNSLTFAALVPYKSPRDTENIIDFIQNRFEKLWQTGDITVRLPAFFIDMTRRKEPWTAVQMTEFLEYAESEAKRNGYNRLTIDDSMLRRIEREKYLIKYMSESIRENRFEVWYQPIHDSSSGKFLSAEALLRLRDRDGTFISPNEFIPLAESNSLISCISWIVLENACMFLSSKPKQIKFVSVNLAITQFTDKHFPGRVSALMDSFGLSHDRIKFEITERIFTSDIQSVKDSLKEMTDRGFSFLLDDFGTGYSNFSSMLQFPFEYIKLDKSLIDTINSDEKGLTTVSSLIKLFHHSGFSVVAEGIETKEQAGQLTELGADFLQGFYFARPMPIEYMYELNSKPSPNNSPNEYMVGGASN